MSRTLSIALCCLFVVSVLATDASAVTITSSNFSLGFGANVNTGTGVAWTTIETNSANTPVTVANANATPIIVDTDFTLTPTVLGRNFSATGPIFTGRVLATGTSNVSAWSRNFEVTLDGVYSGTLPANAFDVKTTVNVSQISIFAHAFNNSSYTTDPNNFHFNETTIGNIGSSLNATTLVNLGSTTGNPANYTQLLWNPTELGVDGFSASRNFNVTGFGDATIAYAIDGLEIFGTIEVSYQQPIPEPSSLALLGFGLLAFVKLRKSRRSAK